MPATLTASGLDVSFGARTLFTGLDLTLAEGDVTAVVGPNGSGKSTLMRVLVGDLPAGAGSVRLAPPGATIAWLPQVLPTRAESLLDYARRRTGVAAADLALESTADALARGVDGAEESYATALEHWLALGAADLSDRLPEVAHRVGLTVDPTRALGSLSGGEAARASLVALLLSRHDVLLLDEPTNDLDRRGLELVVEFVLGHRGPVLVASHDRAFLDRVATDVLELDHVQQRIGYYTGTYSDYVAARDLARAQAWSAYEGYADARDALVDQARQRQEWAAKGHRAVRSGAEAGQAPARARQGPRRQAAGQGRSPAPRGDPARGGGAASQGVAAPLLHQRGPAVGRGGRDAGRRRGRPWRLQARPGQPDPGARRPGGGRG